MRRRVLPEQFQPLILRIRAIASEGIHLQEHEPGAVEGIQ